MRRKINVEPTIAKRELGKKRKERNEKKRGGRENAIKEEGSKVLKQTHN